MRPSRKGIKLGRRTLNKTARVREIAQRMVDEGRPPRPTEIVDAMTAEGIRVTSGQVSLALQGTSLALKEHVKPPARSAFDLPDLNSAMDQVGLDDLIAAQGLVERLGSIKKAAAALVALSRLGGKTLKEEPRTKDEDKSQNPPIPIDDPVDSKPTDILHCSFQTSASDPDRDRVSGARTAEGQATITPKA